MVSGSIRYIAVRKRITDSVVRLIHSCSLLETVSEPEILAILRPMIKRYALERMDKERFGDFVIRAGYIAPTTAGKEWYDRMGGEGQYREA